jgi:shikimate 5-dehydrogenase
MFKWVEIGFENNRPRYEELSHFLNDNGFANSVEFIQTTAEKFSDDLKLSLGKFDGIRVGRGCGEIVIPLFNNHPVMVDKIKAADAIVKTNGAWWLRSNAVEGFHRVLASCGEKFDLESAVLIVGAGAAARVAITSLFVIGFRRFAISSHDEQRVHQLVKELQRSHLGAEFKVIPREGLILLPGTHGVLVNTTPMIKDNPMLEELYYFNFFKTGGVAVDFSILPVDTPLLMGALDVGAHCVYGYQISAQTDIIWCEQVAGRSFSGSDYELRLGKRLRATEVSPA